MTIHILSDRRFPFSGSSLAAVPLLPRSGFVQCLEGSNRSRVTGTAANARDLFEAGLNEAASLATTYGWSISTMTVRSYRWAVQRLDREQNPGIDRSNRRLVDD